MGNAKSELPPIGKVSPEIFNEIILPQLGRKRSSVLVGPQHGVDIGVCDLGHGQVMVTTTDPVFIVPPYGWERSAWFAVHILASDAVTSGLPPTYMTIDLNLPMSITRDELETMWGVIHRESEKMGMAIVSGHTGRYEGCEYPMVGGATVICIGSADKYVTPAMARVGDSIIITKGAAVEAAGLFACTYPQRVAEAYGEKTAREAEEVFWQMSVVEDALTAVEVGVRDEGVTAMHDATECGVWGGLFEVAEASEVGMVVHKDDIILQIKYGPPDNDNWYTVYTHTTDWIEGDSPGSGTFKGVDWKVKQIGWDDDPGPPPPGTYECTVTFTIVDA